MKGALILGMLALIGCGSIEAEKDWWQTMTLYQIYPRSWMDSDGNGVGDLQGITSKLDYLVEAGFDAVWLSPIYASPMVDFGYDISDFLDVDPTFGTLDDFDNLVTKAKSLGLKVIMDFVPGHTSDQHEWFTRSLAGEEPYTDYYIWHNGTTDPTTGIVSPPNNWVSRFDGYAWTWRTERQAYYLHQFTVEQPDLNYRNEYLVQEMKDVLVFWMNRGVDGFRVDAIQHLFEDEDFPDNPLSGTTNVTTSYYYTLPHRTESLDETYDMVSQWRAVLDNYTLYSDNVTRVMMVEAYVNLTSTMKYYEYGAHFPFNFEILSYLDSSSNAAAVKDQIDGWLNGLPENATSDWVIGNHDQNRVSARFSTEQIDALNIINLLLPGVSVTYYGEEIGMEDQWISWEDTLDPIACNYDEDTYTTVSRDPARTPFQWDNSTSAGFSTNSTTWLPVNENYLTLNLAAQEAADVSHYKIFQALTALRKETVVQEGSINLQLLNDDVLAFSREYGNGTDPVFVVVNFANLTQTVNLTVFDSASDDLVVSIASIDSSMTAGSQVSKNSLVLSAYAGLVLRNAYDSTTVASTTTSSDSITTTADSSTATADSVSTTTDGITTTADYNATTTDGITTTADYNTTIIDSITTTADPVSTTTDYNTTTIGPITNTTDSITTTIDPVTTTTDSITNTTDSITTTIDPITNTTDSVTTTVDSITNTTDSITTTIDPITNTTDSVTTTVDSITNTTDSITTTADPVSTTTDYNTTTIDPITNTTDSITTTIDPVTNTTDFISTTIDPVTTTTDSITNTTDSITTTVDDITTTTDSIITTADYITTTVDSITTTTGSITTTADTVTTTSAAITTTAEPMETTSVPITTTSAPITTSADPITTTTSTTTPAPSTEDPGTDDSSDANILNASLLTTLFVTVFAYFRQ